MQQGIVIWQQELYEEFDYKQSEAYFHTFETVVSIAFPFIIFLQISFQFLTACRIQVMVASKVRVILVKPVQLR